MMRKRDRRAAAPMNFDRHPAPPKRRIQSGGSKSPSLNLAASPAGVELHRDILSFQ